MTRRILGSTCVGGMLAATVTFAQGSTQTPTQAPQSNSQQRPSERTPATGARTQTDQQVTLTGCVMREGGSDFVLSSAMPSSASGNLSSGVTGSTSSGAIGTTGTSTSSATSGIGAAGTRYRLSGERDLSSYVGQRVEIVGRMDAGTSATGNGPTGSTRLGTPGIGTLSTSGVGTPATSGVGTPSNSGVGTPSTSAPGTSTPSAGATGSSAGVTGSPSGSSTSGSTSATGATVGSTSSSTPSSPITGAAGTSRSTIPGSTAGQTAAMQHVTIASVRAVGGNCQ